MRRGSRVALRVETCLYELFEAASKKKGLGVGDGVRLAMKNFVNKVTPSVKSKLEKGLTEAEGLNEKRGRKSGSRIVSGKVVGPKEAKKLAKAGKLPSKVVKIGKAKKAKKVTKVAAIKGKTAKKKVSLL